MASGLIKVVQPAAVRTRHQFAHQGSRRTLEHAGQQQGRVQGVGAGRSGPERFQHFQPAHADQRVALFAPTVTVLPAVCGCGSGRKRAQQRIALGVTPARAAPGRPRRPTAGSGKVDWLLAPSSSILPAMRIGLPRNTTAASKPEDFGARASDGPNQHRFAIGVERDHAVASRRFRVAQSSLGARRAPGACSRPCGAQRYAKSAAHVPAATAFRAEAPGPTAARSRSAATIAPCRAGVGHDGEEFLASVAAENVDIAQRRPSTAFGKALQGDVSNSIPAMAFIDAAQGIQVHPSYAQRLAGALGARNFAPQHFHQVMLVVGTCQ